MDGGPSQLDHIEPVEVGHRIGNRRRAPATGMETSVSNSEEFEQNAMAPEDSTTCEEDSPSSDDENEGIQFDDCTLVISKCTCPNAVGSCSCALNAPSSVFSSPRFQGLLMGQKSAFDTAREHWTVVDPESEAEAERIAEDNRKSFDEVLVKH